MVLLGSDVLARTRNARQPDAFFSPRGRGIMTREQFCRLYNLGFEDISLYSENGRRQGNYNAEATENKAVGIMWLWCFNVVRLKGIRLVSEETNNDSSNKCTRHKANLSPRDVMLIVPTEMHAQPLGNMSISLLKDWESVCEQVSMERCSAVHISYTPSSP